MNTLSKTHVVITLTVAAHKLYNIQKPKQRDIDRFCQLSDNNKGSKGDGTIHDFQSDVYANYTVRWVGATHDPNGKDRGYSVAISKIKNKTNTIFGKVQLKGEGKKHASVCDTVKNKIGRKKDRYTIYFKIYKPGAHALHSDRFSIDPKLQGNN
jgi:hypothetical protein